MALRDGRGAGLRRASLGRPGFVALACALYVAVGVAAMWPAPKHFDSRFAAIAEPVPGEAAAGDHLQAVYHLWLVGHQLEHGHAPWLDPYTFRPESSPRVNFGGWPFGLPYWPLAAAFGSVVAWNLLLLLSYLAAGGFACLWLLELGLPRGAALAGGLAFGLAPYRVVQSAGHLRGPVSALLPLALFAFERSRRGSRWWLAGAGAALASIPFSDVHLALGAVPFFLFYAVCRTRSPRLVVGALLGVLAAVGAGLLVRHFAISGSIAAGGRTLREVTQYSADGADFVTRHRGQRLESYVFLGWLTPLLALAGLALLVRTRRLGLATALAVGAVVPILLALGTHFPAYAWIWHHFAPLRYPRVPERELPVACLALAALAAVAVARLGRSLTVWATLLYTVAVLALFADLRVTVYGSARADPSNAAYAALGSRPPGRLLELPVLHPSLDHGSVYLYYDMQARRQRPGGYSTVAPRAAAQLALRLEPLNCGEWRPGTEALLRHFGVRYLAFHAGLFSFGRGWFAWRALTARGWRELSRGGGIMTFGRKGSLSPPSVPEPRTPLVFCPEWNERSPRYRHGAFWIKGSGRLVVRLATLAPDRTTISVDGTSRSARVVRPVTLRLPLRRPGWHLVGVDSVRSDRGLRLAAIAVHR
ncbi:MAG: hypothetical protein WBB76_06260 [Gaiellaceae bacterium]